jgi:protein subunit release factor B
MAHPSGEETVAMVRSVGSNGMSSVTKRLAALGVDARDLKEQFILSDGKGGQNANKVSTAVRLRHLPTGLEVKCREERSQGANRVRAREILAEKLERARREEELGKRALLEKARRRGRGRPARLKRKILADKRKHSEKKRSRSWRPDAD